MRTKALLTALAAATVLSAPVFAELQNVEVGGSLRIRGNMYTNGAAGNNPNFDDDGDEAQFIEQRSAINVTADFTDDVTAFVELDNYGEWGNDFRDDPDTGNNNAGGDETDVYQAYVEMRESWGQPLTIRAGRQEIVLGSEFLVGNNNTSSGFTGLAFDAVSARWDFDGGNVFGWASKLAENELGATNTDDQDTDFYGIYGTYDGIENMTIEGYWMYLRDAADAAAATDDSSDNLHTLGGRIAGNWNALDYEGEAAFQFGDQQDSDDYEGFAVQGILGYTFEDINNLRLWGGLTFLSGGDDNTAPSNDDIGFQRLFSDQEYSEFLDATDLTNVLIVRGGASIQATEAISVSGAVTWLQEDEEFPTVNGDDGVGIEVGLYGTYDYSEDLSFSAGYAHLFTDEDLDDSAFIVDNGTGAVGGGAPTDGGDDADYFFLETSISF